MGRAASIEAAAGERGPTLACLLRIARKLPLAWAAASAAATAVALAVELTATPEWFVVSAGSGPL